MIKETWRKTMPKRKIIASTSDNVDTKLHISKWKSQHSSTSVQPVTGTRINKKHRFAEYTRKKCFNSFVHSAGDTRRQSDENPNSSVVLEAMKLLAKSSHGYQITDRSRNTVTKHLKDEKTHAANNNKLFKKLNHVNNASYQIKLAKAEIQPR